MNKIRILGFFKRQMLLTSCICVLSIFLFFFALNSFRIVYASYDDYPFVVFLTKGDNIFLYIGAFLSKVLALIQNCAPKISIYPMFLVTISLLSFIILNYVLIKVFSFKIGIFFALLFDIIFIKITVLCLQYTQIAGLVCVASSALIICAVQFEVRNYLKIFQIVVGVLLAIIGSQLRFETIIPNVVFTGVYCLCYFVRKFFQCDEKSIKKRISIIIKKHGSLLLTFAIVFSGAFFLNFSSDLLKRSSGFEKHLAYTEARTKVQDYQIALYEGNESFYKTQDVFSKDDFILLTCFKVDNDVYTTETMNAIAQYANEQNAGKTNIYFQYFLSFQNIIARVFGSAYFVYPIMILVCCVALAIVFFLYRVRNKIKALFFVMLFLLWTLFVLYIKNKHDVFSDGLLLLFFLLISFIAVVGNRFQYIGISLFSLTTIAVINYMVFSRFPFRAEYTVIVPAIILLLLLFDPKDIRINVCKMILHIPIKMRIIVTIFFSGVLVLLMQIGLGIFDINAKGSKYDSELVAYMNNHPDSVFFYDCYGCDLVDHAKRDPFAIPDFPENSIQYGGWPVASFFYEKQLEAYNVEHLYKEIINNPNRLFVVTKDDDKIENKHYKDRLIHYYNLHYKKDKEIVFDEVYSTDSAWIFSVVEK